MGSLPIANIDYPQNRMFAENAFGYWMSYNFNMTLVNGCKIIECHHLHVWITSLSFRSYDECAYAKVFLAALSLFALYWSTKAWIQIENARNFHLIIWLKSSSELIKSWRVFFDLYELILSSSAPWSVRMKQATYQIEYADQEPDSIILNIPIG